MKTLFFLLIPFFLNGQKQKSFWLKQGLSIAASATAGFFDGECEVLIHDYRRYQARHPGANAQWANPKLSFKNKYRNYPTDMRAKYPLSKSLLVGGTDKMHLNHTIRNAMVAANVSISISLYQKPNWKHLVLQGLISWGSYALGTGIAHAWYKKID